MIYASIFPLVYSVWTGVRAVNPLWLKAATVMGADETMLFRKVIWPGALPYVIAGLRLSFGRAFIGVIGGELLASPKLGLGAIIFNAAEFLSAKTPFACIHSYPPACLNALILLTIHSLRQGIKTGQIKDTSNARPDQ